MLEAHAISWQKQKHAQVFPLRRIQSRASPAAGREMGSKKKTRGRRFAGRRVTLFKI
jgi:hypothetical protein